MDGNRCLLCECPFDHFPDGGEGICVFCLDSLRAAERTVAKLKAKRNPISVVELPELDESFWPAEQEIVEVVV